MSCTLIHFIQQLYQAGTTVPIIAVDTSFPKMGKLNNRTFKQLVQSYPQVESMD